MRILTDVVHFLCVFTPRVVVVADSLDEGVDEVLGVLLCGEFGFQVG